ncbi:MAG: hypothetical protein H0W87_00940 [Actinobacteria bacterium]|nr:hypothetical protein [Actinomycetota bacterium]
MLRSFRPSPAMVIALIALFVALGGTAYAVKQINGSTLVNRSVSNLKIKKNTLTKTEINLSQLGTIPKANTANQANFAKNSGQLDGHGADFWQQACQDGTVKGYALVNGDTNFPSSFTNAAGNVPDKFNCTGGTVQAKRNSTGNYTVQFASSTAHVGVANSYGPGSFDEYVSINRESSTGDWQVVIHNSSGQPTDHHFTIILS